MKDRLRSGRLVTQRRGVYRFAGTPVSRWDDVLAACLAAGPAALASHRSAGELWGLPVVAEEPEIVVPWPQWPRLPGVVSHQSRLLPDGHRSERHGIPVTTPDRTLVDLAGTVRSERYLGMLVDTALRLRLTTVHDIRAATDLLAGRGRRGVVAMRTVLADRGGGYEAGDSHGEAELVCALVESGLPRPSQQHQVAIRSTVYLIDVAYRHLRLGIEYDGWETHGTRSAFDHDRTRGNALVADGWTLLHVTPTMPIGQAVAEVAAAYHRLTRERGTSEGQFRELDGRE